MATNNPATFFLFYAGKRLQINCVLNGNSIQPEVYEIDAPKFSAINDDQSGTKKRKIEETSHPSEWKKLKIYDQRNFVPLEAELLLHQKDLFYEIISCFDAESILTILRCVCKTWNDWIMVDFDELWKTRYETMCNFEFSKDQLNPCQRSFLFNCHILESAMKKHAKFEKVSRMDHEIHNYEFYQDPDYEKIKKILEPRLFVLDVEFDSKYIGKDSTKDVNITSMLNLGEHGFVKFYFSFNKLSPKYGEISENISVSHKMLLNNSLLEEEELCLLETYNDNYSDPEVERRDELIAKIMSAIGIDRNLIRAFLMFVTFDVAFNYCSEFMHYDCYLSLVGSEKFKEKEEPQDYNTTFNHIAPTLLDLSQLKPSIQPYQVISQPIMQQYQPLQVQFNQQIPPPQRPQILQFTQQIQPLQQFPRPQILQFNQQIPPPQQYQDSLNNSLNLFKK